MSMKENAYNQYYSLSIIGRKSNEGDSKHLSRLMPCMAKIQKKKKKKSVVLHMATLTTLIHIHKNSIF